MAYKAKTFEEAKTLGGYGGWGDTEAKADFLATGGPQFQTAQDKANDLLGKQNADRAAFNTKLAGEQGAFLNKFQTDFPAAIQGIETELGLPGLRKAAFDQTALLEEIPTALTNTGRAASVNADRLTRGIAVATGKQAPIAQKAIAQAQFAEGELGRRTDQALVPYQMEIDMMKDRHSRESTGFNIDLENQLNVLLKQIEQEGAMDRTKIEQATKLAELEQKTKEIANKTTTVDAGNRIIILDGTGREVGSIPKGVAPTNGGGTPSPTINTQVTPTTNNSSNISSLWSESGTSSTPYQSTGPAKSNFYNSIYGGSNISSALNALRR